MSEFLEGIVAVALSGTLKFCDKPNQLNGPAAPPTSRDQGNVQRHSHLEVVRTQNSDDLAQNRRLEEDQIDCC